MALNSITIDTGHHNVIKINITNTHTHTHCIEHVKIVQSLSLSSTHGGTGYFAFPIDNNLN